MPSWIARQGPGRLGRSKGQAQPAKRRICLGDLGRAARAVQSGLRT